MEINSRLTQMARKSTVVHQLHCTIESFRIFADNMRTSELLKNRIYTDGSKSNLAIGIGEV